MRASRLLILVLCALALVMPDIADAARGRAHHRVNPRVGLKDPRYSALIMNPKTGEVYHQQGADTRRYPASLTKMMTLYLLFEELEQHKISLNTRLRVSDYASMQPQTNISLTPFDTIPVETAIKALVVRSANDVAVVVAENLGGSVPHFAQMMTAKARFLGMRSTTFKNPNGLPDSRQITTARDMAKLGIALKRDFPQYYQYFSTRQFSWQGVTYYTHNRVMLRYSGTDGIKTGYTLASGFNIVTSTERGGRPVIGVVMGGSSGNWRDNRMIELLDGAYMTIAKRGNARGTVIAKNLPAGGPQPEPEKPRIVTTLEVAPVPADRGEIATAQAPVQPPSPAQVQAMVQAQAPAPAPAPVTLVEPAQPTQLVTAPPAPTPTPPPVQSAPAPQIVAAAKPTPPPPPNTLNAQWAALQRNRMDAGVGDMWGIQVGAFSSRTLAERAALQAYQLAGSSLQGSRISVIGTGNSSSMVHRARLENITENQAKKACETLISNNSPCFIFRAGAQNL